MAKKTKQKKTDVIHTSGKRKKAIARATLTPGSGVVRINRRNVSIIQPELARLRLQEPLMLAGDFANKVDIDVTVHGGGFSGQVEASRLAIAKALVEHAGDEELKKTFLDYDRHLLVADTRYKEPKKFGTHSRARAKRQKSYR